MRALIVFSSILPAKLCWLLMSRLVRGPESMMQFHGGRKEADVIENELNANELKAL